MLVVVLVAAVQVQQVLAPFKTHHLVTVALVLHRPLLARQLPVLVVVVAVHGTLEAAVVVLEAEALEEPQGTPVLEEL
jgi:hypothetical protein